MRCNRKARIVRPERGTEDCAQPRVCRALQTAVCAAVVLASAATAWADVPRTPADLRQTILNGPYGSISIEEAVQTLVDMPGGPEIQQLLQTLAARKTEALPVVKEKLRTGKTWEKHVMTRLLQYSPWPEAYPELIALARDTRAHWLPRQGALYALGALGDAAAGPDVMTILGEPACPRGVRLVAIATLARIGYRDAATAIRKFTGNEDVHLRLFASRALAEFGEPVDRASLLSALKDADYVVRLEACDALAGVDGDDVTEKLRFMGESDGNEAVRTTARIGMLRRATKDRSASEKLSILRNALTSADRRTSVWIVRTILDECEAEGQVFVEQLAAKDDRIGERARASLISRTDVVSNPSFVQPEQAADDGAIEPLHADVPTHQTLMEYAMTKAGGLETPLTFTGTQQTRLWEGARDEDLSLRYRNHGYNPLTDTGFLGEGTTARAEALTRWNSMADAFLNAQFDGGDDVGAWHYLGRASHLLQDMSAPLHALGTLWHIAGCRFEAYWQSNDAGLRFVLAEMGGPLHSNDPLPPEATARHDAFTQQRLEYRYDTSCPNKGNDDVRGWIEVLAWTTYFRATYWGEVTFGSSGSSGPATSSQTSSTVFTDGSVGVETNALHTMFSGNIRWIANWTDYYYEITDRNGYVFRWMSWTDIDDWSSCGRNWANGYKDSSIRIGGNDDDDSGVRITGRFWFDTCELGKDTSGSFNRRCYPNRYPNGDAMTDDLHLYYGSYGYPLTVRYNAGLLGLANRRVTVKTNAGQADGFAWSRKDNHGNGPAFAAASGGTSFYFVAKSAVDLVAPSADTNNRSFRRWLKDGSFLSTSRTITVNTSSSPIPRTGVVLTAMYGIPADFDADSDVDLTDFAHFRSCFNGPNRPFAQSECGNTDLDADNDVDLEDFGVFRACFNGPNRPAACE